MLVKERMVRRKAAGGKKKMGFGPLLIMRTPSSCVLVFHPSFISWPWALPQPGTSRVGAGAAVAFACQCWGAA